jgi:hypothetical protein
MAEPTTETATIVRPVIGVAIIATVTTPILGPLQCHRVPCAAGAALVLLAVLAGSARPNRPRRLQ